MAIFIEMPKLSDTMTEGTLLKWHVKEGDAISVGDVLADIETDKATMEMEAFDDGILGRIYIGEGEKAPLSSFLAVLVEEGEEVPDAPEVVAEPPAAAEAQTASKPAAVAPAGGAPAAAAVAVAAKTSSGRIKASPLARKIAANRGVNIAAIAGTGPGGRIVRRDVENAPVGAAAPAAGGAAIQAIRPNTDFDPDVKRIPLTGMRTLIAERLLVSKSTIPHFYLNVDLDAAPMMKMRKQVNEGAANGGNKFTVNDFILKATVLAAVDTPEVNASFDGDAIVQFSTVNLSVAIAVTDGLVTPVIRDAQKKSMLEISQAVKDFAERAKNKKLSPDEFANGTITVSNLGAYGIANFDAIINPPQAVILSIGGISKKPVVNDAGEIVTGLRIWVGMSCDHRVVDGAVGATYLQAFRKYIENPELMLV
ncbi:MAG: pyruvate dehydrogenase E2 component (dihydrolipoamide acetyltransferase) [Verrucomicrobiales bacterium]|jgi:pyruvate dehydrogenase E2 component (dihydrolipoamide acetyltransferase)